MLTIGGSVSPGLVGVAAKLTPLTLPLLIVTARDAGVMVKPVREGVTV
jgi:hypothetical protein